jgi:hypothetical protein
MGVAKWNVGHRNVGANVLAGLRDGNVRISKSRSANESQSFISDYHPPLDTQMIADSLKCPPLPLRCPLSIVDVQSGGF